MIDLNLISRGEHYSKLNRSYIIFICTFDSFGEGLYQYTFESRCREKLDLVLNDEATRICLNTKGKKDDVSGHVKRFLKFIDSDSEPEPGDRLLCMMNYELQKVRKSEEWKREYMTLFLRDQENIEKGRQEGRTEERRERILTMLKNGVSAEQVAKITGISLEEIKKVESEHLTMI